MGVGTRLVEVENWIMTLGRVKLGTLVVAMERITPPSAPSGSTSLHRHPSPFALLFFRNRPTVSRLCRWHTNNPVCAALLPYHGAAQRRVGKPTIQSRVLVLGTQACNMSHAQALHLLRQPSSTAVVGHVRNMGCVDTTVAAV